MGLTKPHEKRQRALALMQKVIIEGKTKKKAAEEMGISHDTAERALAWAEGAKLFVEYEHRLFGELLPLATQTAKEAMEDGDATVAMKIMDMVEKKASKNAGAGDTSGGGLYEEIERQRAGGVIDVTPERYEGTHAAGAAELSLSRHLGDGGVLWIKTNTTDQSESRPEIVVPKTEGDGE